MKNKINKIVVLGGGAAGWFTAGYIKYHNPEIEITLIESQKVGIIGVGESTIPQLGDFFREMGIDERDWMSQTNSIYKLGNKFVGWNSEGQRHHVTDHWNVTPKEEQYFSFSFPLPEKHLTSSFYNQLSTDDYFYNSDGKHGVDDKWNDYWLQMLRDGEVEPWDMDDDLYEQTSLMKNNKSPFDEDDRILVGQWQAHTYHVDAERFVGVVRDRVALPNGVSHVWGHVEDIVKSEDGYVEKLVLEDGSEFEADLFFDCTGFGRILTGTMDNGWHDYEHIWTRDAIVAPIRYKDPENEMRPYSQSNAQDEGWNFIVTLYTRMGSGYVFDSTEISPEDAKAKFIKYWEGWEFIKEPRHISWDAGRMETSWNKNVIGIGGAVGFAEPMEANALYIAQAGIQLANRAIQRAKEKEEVISRGQLFAYNKGMRSVQDHIADFISFHYTLSEREDTPFWRKVKQYGIDHNHKERCWEEYRSPSNYIGHSVYPDYLWAHLAVHFNKFDDSYELFTKPRLMNKARLMFEYQRKMSEAQSEIAMNAYEWHKKFMFNGKTSAEALDELLKKVSRNLY